MIDTAALIRCLQEQLLASAHEYFLFGDRALSEPVRSAFFAVPRHRFLSRYQRLGSAHFEEVDDDNLVEHLPVLYRDNGLGIGVGPSGEGVTISAPAIVLYMLELLGIEPGNRVFEVGAGSGWNAALMGHLAGPGGYVETFEIIPELAERARAALDRAGRTNVRVVCGDAGLGSATDEPFDRVVFTAGSHDIPGWLFDRVRPGGLMLLVLKFPGGGDFLTLFRREPTHFEALTSRACEFVWMRGTTHDATLDPILLEDFPAWSRLREKPSGSRPFACGGRSDAELGARTIALRSFLSLVEPRMRWFVGREGWPFYSFGLFDEESDSLAVVRGGRLLGYGGPSASEALVQRVHEWVERGMPSVESMPLRAYRSGTAPAPAFGEILLRRPATDFVWRLG
jgi:protein-L-isoaspartate(D-aspartate) O-methyltransferase